MNLTIRRGAAGIAAGVLAAALLSLPGAATAGGGRTAGPPTDYRKVDGLSKPEFPKTARQSFDVEMHDGIHLYVEATMPDPKRYGKKKWPVIMEVSPYHGTLADREGTRIFPDPDKGGEMIGLTGYFAPRGYAVVMVDLRGTGKSEGCLDHLGPNDAKDLKTIIEWAAKQPWSNGKVGLTGHSYVGSTPSIAAAQKPKGLVTIAPSAGLTSMYDHQFQWGVPYNLQWAGPMFAYEQLSIERHLPGEDNTGEDMQYFGCGAANSSLTAGHGQVTGQYQAWHAARDWRKGASKADIPIFMIHGVNDNAARIAAAEWFFGKRFGRSDDKVWLGQWMHGSSGNAVCQVAHPNCRFEQWQYALHAWFDKHLQGRRVDTGPPVEVFLNDGDVFTDKTWTRPSSDLTLYADASKMTLTESRPKDEASASFNGANQTLEFESAPFKRDTLFVGPPPRLRLHASLTGSQVVHLVTTLFKETKSGERVPANYCAMQPQLREGTDTISPIIPGEVMDLEPQCFTIAHHVEKGERLVLVVGTTSPHHVGFAKDVRITIHTGPDATSYELPVVPNPVLYKDVPLGEGPQ